MRQGDTDMGSPHGGTGRALVCEIEPAALIVEQMMSGAEAVMRALGSIPEAQ